MIDKKSLRIGNLLRVKNTETILEVVEITRESVGYSVFESDVPAGRLPDVEYLPLTEEWLLKFGFAEEGPEFWELGYSYSHGWVTIRVMKIDTGFWFIVDAANKGVNFGIIYNYVHQLQNLYFGIKCEELELKELVSELKPYPKGQE